MADTKQYLDKAGLGKVFNLLAGKDNVITVGGGAVPEPWDLTLGQICLVNSAIDFNNYSTYIVDNQAGRTVNTGGVLRVVKQNNIHKYTILFDAPEAAGCFKFMGDVTAPRYLAGAETRNEGEVYILSNGGSNYNNHFVADQEEMFAQELPAGLICVCVLEDGNKKWLALNGDKPDLTEYWRTTDVFMGSVQELNDFYNNSAFPFGNVFYALHEFDTTGANIQPEQYQNTVVPAGTLFIKTDTLSTGDPCEWIVIAPQQSMDSVWKTAQKVSSLSAIQDVLTGDAPYGTVLTIAAEVDPGASSIFVPIPDGTIPAGSLCVKTKAAHNPIDGGGDCMLLITPGPAPLSTDEVDALVDEVLAE